MSTNHHTPVTTGAAANAAVINSPLGQLDAAITAGLGGITLTNKSGGALAANDCVIVDTSNDEAVTTTTTEGDTTAPAIVLSGGANNVEVTVTRLGEVTVIVDAAGSRGDWIKTSATAKRVTPTATLDDGVFGILLEAAAGAGSTAAALLLGAVVVPAGSHSHAASDITSGTLALARGGANADLSATGGSGPDQYLKQAGVGANVSVSAIVAADLPAATTSAQGAAELATNAETETGTDTGRTVTPAGAADTYFKKSEHIDASSGATDAGKPVKLDGGGNVDASMLNASDIDHSLLQNLTIGDPHTQYLLESILTTKGDVLVRNAAGTIVRLGVGADNQVLEADSGETAGIKWAAKADPGSGIPGSIMDAKGDLVVGTADDTYAKRTVGANGQVLTADSGEAMGVGWETPIKPWKNLLINGNFDVWQRGTSFTAATTPANNDDAYLVDRWILLSDGNDIVDVSQQSASPPDGSRFFLKADVETINKKFGFVTILEAADAIPLRGKTVSLSFKCKSDTGHQINNVRAAVLAWDGTEDTVTSDVASAWGATGTNPTWATNWTAENTASDHAVSTSWATVEIENISLDTSGMNNLAVVIWVDDTDAALEDVLYLAQVMLEVGETCTEWQPKALVHEMAACLRYYEELNYSGDVRWITNLMLNSTAAAYGGLKMFDTKRAAPTVSISDISKLSILVGATTFNSPSAVTISATADGWAKILYSETMTAMTAGHSGLMLVQSGESVDFAADAEL